MAGGLPAWLTGRSAQAQSGNPPVPAHSISCSARKADSGNPSWGAVAASAQGTHPKQGLGRAGLESRLNFVPAGKHLTFQASGASSVKWG